jgi:hypothetical protein
MIRPTIDDVAQMAGVSKSIVSRVLSGNAIYMREETRLRVEKAIIDLQYRPSSVARSLVSNRTHTVGLLISDVSNPFYPEVIHGVENVALASAAVWSPLCEKMRRQRSPTTYAGPIRRPAAWSRWSILCALRMGRGEFFPCRRGGWWVVSSYRIKQIEKRGR